MAKNVSRNPTKPKSKPAKGIFKVFDSVFNMDKIWGGVFPAHQFKYILWVSFLIVIYIAVTLKAEKMIRQIDYLKVELEEVRADYTTQKAAFMKSGKQSEIIKKVTPLGLEENKIPPTKLIID